MRAAFEAWAQGPYSIAPENPCATGGRFLDQGANDAWEGWQAGRKSAAAILEQMAAGADEDDFAAIALMEAAAELRGE